MSKRYWCSICDGHSDNATVVTVRLTWEVPLQSNWHDSRIDRVLSHNPVCSECMELIGRWAHRASRFKDFSDLRTAVAGVAVYKKLEAMRDPQQANERPIQDATGATPHNAEG